MKKTYALLAAMIAATGLASAQQMTKPLLKAQQKIIYAKQNAPKKVSEDYDFEAFYAAPDGVFYIGGNKSNNFNYGAYAAGPADVELKFTTKYLDYFNPGDYMWDDTVENEDYTYTLEKDQINAAPLLYVAGVSGYDTYKMAQGILGGYGSYNDGDDEYLLANYNSEEFSTMFWDMGTLSTNYEDANTQLNEWYSYYAPVFKNIVIKGFAESFSYAAPYKLEATCADIVCPEEITADDVVAEIYSDVDGTYTKLGTYNATLVNRHDADSEGACYYVKFESDEPLTITTPIMIAITNSEGNTKNISPTENVTMDVHYGQRYTSYIYADYTAGGNSFTNGFIPFQHVQMQGYGGRTHYLDHWTVGIKQNYDVELDGIESAIIDKAEADNNATYTISGVRVNDKATMQRGIYVRGGKKFIVK